MGDYRFHIDLKFSMGNHNDKTSMSLNWAPDDDHGLTIDHRVIEWLDQNFERGVACVRMNINDSIREYLTQQERKEREADLEELERLREKYPYE